MLGKWFVELTKSPEFSELFSAEKEMIVVQPKPYPYTKVETAFIKAVRNRAEKDGVIVV